VEPLAIYVSAVALLLLASFAVGIWKHVPTRKCHLCGAKVELGRGRCPVCGYRFAN
jgi:hypothetical protein